MSFVKLMAFSGSQFVVSFALYIQKYYLFLCHRHGWRGGVQHPITNKKCFSLEGAVDHSDKGKYLRMLCKKSGALEIPYYFLYIFAC